MAARASTACSACVGLLAYQNRNVLQFDPFGVGPTGIGQCPQRVGLGGFDNGKFKLRRRHRTGRRWGGRAALRNGPWQGTQQRNREKKRFEHTRFSCVALNSYRFDSY